MAQKGLPYEYEIEEGKAGLTAFGGLSTYLDLASATGFLKSIDKHLRIRTGEQGWTDRQMILSGVLLNLVGGDCVEDVDKLEADEGICRILRKVELHGLTRKEKKAMKKRWRKERTRTFPSASAIFRYLSRFHNAEQEKLREKGKAFIPEANGHLKALTLINRDLISFQPQNKMEATATLEMEATLSASFKKNALFSSKGYQAYQPINRYWNERDLMLHTEFRDGDVPAGHEQLRVLKEALECLPLWVRKVRLRSDTAGYQHDLLRYCDEKDNKRFGRIEFAIGCDVTQEFRKAVAEVPEEGWQKLYRKVKGQMQETGRQWAEVCFVPNKIGHSKKGPEYRYLATREELIPWLYQRCGKSEEAHAAMKNDFAGGQFPSGDFGENAAWWWIMVLSYNLNVLMKRLVLGELWVNKRMKAVRFGVINVAARVIEHSRRVLVRISGNHPASSLLIGMRRRIALLAEASG